jgi:hypothetical protein
VLEKVYYSDSEYVVFEIPDSGAVGCFMSGGADSSLMCYLIAHTIVKHKLPTQVFPITAEFLQRPYNLRCASDVVNKVSELTGFKFNLHPCFILPNHRRKITDDEKVVIMSEYTRAFAEKFQLQTIFNGLTANPPLEAIPDTTAAHRQPCRDQIAWREGQKNKKGLTVPFIDVDKKVIGTLYKRFNLLESLLPLTRSCEAELEETSYFTKNCFDVRKPGEECWWCLERAYGFGSQ